MKAVIVELKEKFAAALADDGSFIKIKNDNYAVGQQIEVHRWSVVGKKLSSHIASIAAGFVFTCILGYGAYAYMTPESYVSLDVNPSIEYTLNRFERVLYAQAVNEDGSRILEKINLKNFSNKTIDEVMTLTIEEITREGYFDGEMPGGILIATSGKTSHSAQEMAEHLGNLTRAQCEKNKLKVSVKTITADSEQLSRAKAIGLTPGKMLLLQELQDEYPDDELFDTAIWKDKSVKEILAEIRRLEEIEDEQDRIEDQEDKAEEGKADNTDKDNDEEAILSEEEKIIKSQQEKQKEEQEKQEELLKEQKENEEKAKQEAAEKAEEAAEKAKEAAKKAAKEAAEAAKEAAEKAEKEAEDAKEAEEKIDSQTPSL